MNSMKIKLFTHTDLDGVGCAILAYLAFGRENVDVEYCDYNNIDEKVDKFFRDFSSEDSNLKYDMVYITDISISDELAFHIYASYPVEKNWRLFDHHATALGLNKYDWCDVKVTLPVKKSANDHSAFVDDVKTSGTELFYEYLCSAGYFNYLTRLKLNVIRFVEIVRDYDTWRWKDVLGADGVVCKQINDLFYIYGRDKFIAWAIGRIHDILGRPFPSFDAIDELLLSQKQKDIDIYVEQKTRQLGVMIDDFDNEYGVVFAERYFSELGNRLCELHPELAYIVMVDICDGKISYRTIRDDIDLGGEIAHALGGGGHRKAAGSKFNADDIQETVLNALFSIQS